MAEKYLVGFDIGGTNARFALIAQNGDDYKIVASSKQSIRALQNPDELAQNIVHTVRTNLEYAGVSLSELSGIGIAIAGQTDVKQEVIINAPNLNWKEVNFKKIILEQFHDLPPSCRISIANDLNAIAWGEYNFGAAQSLSHLLVIYVGTGIGSGIILNKKLYLGAGAVSGEIGHSKFPHNHKALCGCGQNDCVEAFAGGKAIEYRIQHDIQNQLISRAELGLGEDESPSAKTIEAAHKMGLNYAVKFWDEVALQIAHLAANALALLNPDAILLGGGVLQGCPILLSKVINQILQLAPVVSTQNLQFIKPSLYDDAGTLGAALLCVEQ
ncbi:MAG: ROK family protein [Bradymonadales bacterium]|jgi:glucokinase